MQTKSDLLEINLSWYRLFTDPLPCATCTRRPILLEGWSALNCIRVIRKHLNQHISVPLFRYDFSITGFRIFQIKWYENFGSFHSTLDSYFYGVKRNLHFCFKLVFFAKGVNSACLERKSNEHEIYLKKKLCLQDPTLHSKFFVYFSCRMKVSS